LEITIFARVVAKPVNYPDDIEMLYSTWIKKGFLPAKYIAACISLGARYNAIFWLMCIMRKRPRGIFVTGNRYFSGTAKYR